MMRKFFAAGILLALLSGCYKDKKELLYPETDCDTANVTFAADVQPVMSQSCAISGCHAGAAPASGIDLSTYSGVQIIAMNGRLVGVINQSTGFSAMPKGAAKLSDCVISKISKWVADGAPNN